MITLYLVFPSTDSGFKWIPRDFHLGLRDSHKIHIVFTALKTGFLSMKWNCGMYISKTAVHVFCDTYSRRKQILSVTQHPFTPAYNLYAPSVLVRIGHWVLTY